MKFRLVISFASTSLENKSFKPTTTWKITSIKEIHFIVWARKCDGVGMLFLEKHFSLETQSYINWFLIKQEVFWVNNYCIFWWIRSILVIMRIPEGLAFLFRILESWSLIVYSCLVCLLVKWGLVILVLISMNKDTMFYVSAELIYEINWVSELFWKLGAWGFFSFLLFYFPVIILLSCLKVLLLQ